MGSLLKKLGMFLLAIAVPVVAILVYEGFIWSENRESQQRQEQRANEQQAREQPGQAQRERQLAADRIARLERARQLEAQRELQRLQQAIGENQENSLLRCAVAESDDQCRCFDQNNNVVAVDEPRCRSLSGAQ